MIFFKRPQITILVFVILAYWPVSFFLFSIKWDSINISLPWRFFIANAINTRELPLWYPYQFCGFGQFVDPQTWYWPSWIIGIWGYSNLSLHFEYIAHLTIASWGFYKLSKYFNIDNKVALIIALIYSSSGFFVGNFQHLGWIISASWLPFVYYNVLKLIDTLKVRYILQTALFSYLFISGGYWGIVIPTFYSLILIFLLKVINKKNSNDLKQLWQYLSLAALLILLVSAIIIISTYSSINLISRGDGLTPEESVNGSFYFIDFLTLFIPFATYTNWDFWLTDVSLSNIYIGTFTLNIILFWIINRKLNIKNQKIKVALLLSVVSIILSMGKTIPIWPLLGQTLPFFKFLRFPATMRIFFISGALIAFGIILSEFIKRKIYPSSFFRWVGILYILTSVFLITLNFRIEILSIKDIKSLKETNLLPFTAAFQLFASGLILTLAGSKLVTQKSYIKKINILLMLIIIEIFFSVQLNLFNTVVNRNVKAINIYNKIAILRKDNIIPTVGYSLIKNDSISKVLFPYGKNSCTYTKLVSYSGYTPYQYKTWLKLEKSKVFNSIKLNPFIYTKAENNSPQPSIALKEFTNNKIVISAKSPISFKLYLSQNYHNSWKAFIDNEDILIQKSNISLMSINVPKGAHIVKFIFKPLLIITGFWISFISFILLTVWVIIINLKNKLC